MTILAISRNRSPPRVIPQRAVVTAYGTALFLSAALLFGLQPMFAKMVLPRLGGSASVWSVAMVFFQTMLLAGYLYAHLLTRYLRFGLAATIHFSVLAATFLALPIAIAANFGRPPADGQASGSLACSCVGRRAVLRGRRQRAVLEAWFVRRGARKPKTPIFSMAPRTSARSPR